ncbi:MAG TPA: AarF/ABC1/UbiB kinase family protein [Solirubrobacterales bacterium]|nr:AarF/ABC1/UbiB kinase family protein [Solirubrobacterales bacterium]
MTDSGAGNQVRRGAGALSVGARVLLGETAAALRGGGSEERTRKRMESYASRLGGMRGATMKLGQLLSFADLLPEEKAGPVKEAFAVLQGDVPPMDEETMRVAVRDALGPDAFDAFESFDPEPIAAASIGQVHRAALRDGRPVAVKVQYPEVAAAVDGDLRNGKALFRLINIMRRTFGGPLGNDMDLDALFAELAERVREELDYELEAQRTQLFADLYADHPFIRVPGVVDELSTSRILTTDLGSGRRWKDVGEADEELRSSWGEAIFRMTMASLSHSQVQNADPNPGNFLFGDDGGVTFIDFGCVKHYEPRFVEHSTGMAAAAMEDDPAALYEAMVGGGFIDPDGPEVDPEVMMEWLRPTYVPFATSEPFAFSHEYVSGAMRQALQPEGEVAAEVKRVRFPAEYLMLERVILGMYSILAELGARRPWGEIQREIWGQRGAATEFGEREAAWRAERAANRGNEREPEETKAR